MNMNCVSVLDKTKALQMKTLMQCIVEVNNLMLDLGPRYQKMTLPEIKEDLNNLLEQDFGFKI